MENKELQKDFIRGHQQVIKPYRWWGLLKRAMLNDSSLQNDPPKKEVEETRSGYRAGQKQLKTPVIWRWASIMFRFPPLVAFLSGGEWSKNSGNLVEVHHLFIPFHQEPPHLNRKKLIRDSNQWEVRFLLEGCTSIKAIRNSFQNGTPPKQQKPLGHLISQSSPKGAIKGATESNWKQLLSGFVLVASTWKNFPRPQYPVWVNWLNSC